MLRHDSLRYVPSSRFTRKMKRLVQITLFLNFFCVLLTMPSEQSFNEAEITAVETNTRQLANGINKFGYTLLGKMTTHKKYENVVISPTGISGLLAMTLIGTVGKTYKEIADSLGFSHDIYSNRQYHDQFGKLLQRLHFESNISKTLYTDLYREYVKMVYRSDTFNIDFKDSVQAKDNINEWVKNNTEGEIQDFLKSTLPKETRIILLSALYFRGQWEQVFLPEFTTKMPFTGIENGQVMADFMLNVGEFRYIFSEKYGAQMVALPYNDSVTTMYVLKPMLPKETTLPQLLARLDHAKIEDLIDQMSTHKCVIRLPKMELQRTNQLEAYLKDMGVRSIFEPVKANFALMIDNNPNITQNNIISRIGEENDLHKVRNILNKLPNPGIYVDTVLHDVKLTINEYGTEAVSATAGILARTAEQFYADSPFYMFIRNEKTKLITFSAAIFDPTA
ncbi:hypothetical protein K1T71_008817 [Dendrolimus kikuchii]|uniref:Uncharacterized protein n=1 Tax=Dendrolimus kikuchii TaxID=765133 RepID=A0ACC1CVI0_9NEOP|nr:hypothetical protein K1T71_008817 [Dendrolimus kikuchii]